MTQRFDQDLILGYVEGELDDAQRASFEAELENDHALRSLVAQLKLDRQRLRSLAQRSAPVGMVDLAIQTHERNHLLGEPESADPLPRIEPMNPHRFRRVMTYAAVAAVLLISAALIVPTLMPMGLLSNPSPITGNLTPPAPGSAPAPGNAPGSDTGSDEYDSITGDELAVNDQPQPETDPASSAVADAPPVAKLANSNNDEATADSAQAPLAEADQTGSAKRIADAQPAEPTPTVQSHTPKIFALAPDPPEAKITDTAPAPDASPTLATHDQPDSPDPFLGYNDESPNTTVAKITDHNQLLITAASPRIARRSLRNWANNHNARLTRADADAPNPPTNTPDRSYMVIEIKPEQLPDLIDHLNQNPTQHAQLVAMADTNTPAQPNTETQPQTPNENTALANRRIDTHNHWPTGVSIAQGIAGPVNPNPDTQKSPDKPTQTSNKITTKGDTTSNDTSTSSGKDDTTSGGADNKTSGGGGGNTSGGDWADILNRIMARAAQPTPATDNEQPTPKAPLLQPAPEKPLRLHILIEQVADDDVNQ